MKTPNFAVVKIRDDEKRILLDTRARHEPQRDGIFRGEDSRGIQDRHKE